MSEKAFCFSSCNLFCMALIIANLLTGCTERGISIEAQRGPKPIDTFYMAAIETAQPKNVLIEEFTGVSCPPCPSGHAIVKSIKQQYPNRIVVVANHIYNFPQAEPVKGASRQDFRTNDATETGKIYGGIGFMPAAVIDRIKIAGEYLLTSTSWANAVATQIAKPSMVNLYVTSSFDASLRKSLVTVKIAYMQEVTQKHFLTLTVTESNITDAQKNQLSVDSFYTHNYVLRDIITNVGGDPIIDSIQTKQSGLVIERVFDVTIPGNWNAENCKIIAFVHSKEGETMNVYQAVETPLKK